MSAGGGVGMACGGAVEEEDDGAGADDGGGIFRFLAAAVASILPGLASLKGKYIVKSVWLVVSREMTRTLAP